MPERGTGVSWRVAAACIALLALCFNQAVHSAPGELDRGFSADGGVLTDLGGFEGASAVVVQPDGKLVAAGTAVVGGNRDFALARYHPDGSLDTSFGAGGLVLTDFGDWTDDGAASLAIQPDGKLVAAGFSNAGRPGDFDFALARYNPDGSLDTGFDVDGILRTSFRDNNSTGGNAEGANALVIQPDGKIVAAGFSDGGNAGDSDFALARYNPDGSLDPSFSGGGFRTFFGGNSESAKALVIQPDGKLVAAGFSNAGGADDFDFALARYNPDGNLDPTFDGGIGANGAFRTFLGGSSEGANALVVQPDGKLVAAGFSNAGGPGNFDFALVRYLPNGSLDTGFDFDGTLRTSFDGGDSEGGNALVIQADGKLIAAGFSNGAGPDDFDFAVARYNFDGSLDPSFGGGGFRTFLGGGNFEGAEALAIQPDGKLVAAGFSNSGGDDDFALTRYVLTDDTPPPPPLCGGRPVTILGTSGNDTIRGTDGPDVILALGGNDVIRGLGGEDTLCGGPGKDTLIGGPGRDRMFGQGGRDRLFGDKGKDRHHGGSGRDTCDRDRVEIAKGCERTTGSGRPNDPPPRVPPPTPPIAGICNSPGCL